MVPYQLKSVYYRAHRERISRGVLRQFQDYYSSLDDKNDVFYMMVTSGLLHWACKSLSLIPPHVNVVVIGAGLTGEETGWIQQHANRPFFALEQRYDDRMVWELLFRVNCHNFGWIDADCFIFNAGLFHELSEVAEQTSMNCIWSYDYGRRITGRAWNPVEFIIHRPYFLFVNTRAIQAIEENGFSASPRMVMYKHRKISRTMAEYRDYNLLSYRARRQLKKVLPYDSKLGYIYPLSEVRRPGVELEQLDDLVLFQLMAECHEYHIHKVRDLTEDDLSRFVSDEAIHFGSSSYYRNFNHPNHEYVPDWRRQQLPFYRHILLLDYALLQQFAPRLPRQYTALKRLAVSDMSRIGIRKEAAIEELRQFLAYCCISDETMDRLLNGD